jgi:hypothetical protein
MVNAKVLVVGVVVHGAVRGRGDKIDIMGEIGLLGFEEFDHHLSSLVQVLSVNMNLNRGSVTFLITGAEGGTIRDDVNFKVEVFCFKARWRTMFTVSRR